MSKEDWWCGKHQKKPDVSTMLTKCAVNGHICSKLELKVDMNEIEIPA
jgi:hypothetical protein